MNRLDEIKALTEYVSRKPSEVSATFHIDAVRTVIANVPALVAAVEAVLELHEREADGYGGWMCATCLDDERGFDPEREPWPCDTVIAIRRSLGEDA